jgi:hypothetical protein
MSNSTVDYGRPASNAARINFRMIAFASVLLALIGYPIYVYFDSVVSGGIKQAGGGYLEVDLKAMSVFPFDQANGRIDDVPRRWRDLDGKKVVVYGEMWAPYSAGSQLAGFQLCYSIAKCCFNGPPQVQHFVDCRVIDGASVDVYPNLVRVKGVLHVNVKSEEGKVKSVYQMVVESVDPA